MKPLVSVVLPTICRERMLLEAIASVLAQTYQRFELLVVSDGATAPAPIHALAKSGQLRLFELPRRLGPAGARDHAIRQATGQIVAYLDDDDLFHPDHLAVIVEGLTVPGGPPVVYTDAENVLLEERAGGWHVVAEQATPCRDFDFPALLVCNYIPLICVGHTIARYQEVGGFNAALRQLEDWELLIRLTRSVGARHLNSTTATYRHHQGLARVNTLDRQCVQIMQTIYEAHQVAPPLERQRQELLVDLARRHRLVRRRQAARPVPPRLALVSERLGKGDLADAERILVQLLDELPEDGELLLFLSRIMALTRRPAEARQLTRRARQCDPLLFAV